MSPLECIGIVGIGLVLGHLADWVTVWLRMRAHRQLVRAAHRAGFDEGYSHGTAGAFRFVVVGLPVDWSPRWPAERRLRATLACCEHASRAGWLRGFVAGNAERAEAELAAQADQMADEAERYANTEGRG